MNQAPALLAAEQRGEVDTQEPPRPKGKITLSGPLQGVWVLVAAWDVEHFADFHQRFFSFTRVLVAVWDVEYFADFHQRFFSFTQVLVAAWDVEHFADFHWCFFSFTRGWVSV